MFYFVSCSLIWGLTWIAITYQFHSVDSNVAVFYRFICASFILFGYAKSKGLPLKFKKENHLNFALQGFFMFCFNYLLTYWASQLAPSALLALAFTSLIYFNIFGGYIFFKTAIDRKVLYGGFVSLVGMTAITYNELNGIELHTTSIIGFFISLVATASASAGNLISLKSRKDKIPIASNNAWGMLYGSLATFLFCLISQKSFALHNVDSSFVLSFIYLTVFGTILSFGAYLKLLDTLGPSKAAFTSVVSPLVAFVVSYFFENLQLSWPLLFGIILCIFGNSVALAPKDLLKKRPYAH